MAFNGAFLSSTVGMAVVDGDMKEGFKRVFMEKLRAIIGENRPTSVRMPPRSPEEWTVSIWKCPGSV